MKTIQKYRDAFAIIISVLTILSMFYKTANFITAVDARLMVLESTSKDMKKDLHTIVEEQAKDILTTTTELKLFESQTNQRLNSIEASLDDGRRRSVR